MKAVLVIDIPEEWANKRLVDVKIMDIVGGSFTLYQQKIRPLPQRKHLDESLFFENFKLEYLRFDGWNACLDEIMGETDGYL